MERSSFHSSRHGFSPPAAYDLHGQGPFNNYRGRFPSKHQWRAQFPSSYSRDRPPGPPPPPPSHRRPNFIVQLLSNSNSRGVKKAEIEGLISKLTFKPYSVRVCESGNVLGTIYYQQWFEALETVVQLWDMRLKNGHLLSPRLIQNVQVPSDKDELRDRLKPLFLAKLKGLFEDELVKKWERKLERVLDEVREVDLTLKKLNKLREFNELKQRKDGLVKEGDFICNRVEEFKTGVQCLVDYLEGKGEEEGLGLKVGVFKFGREFDWEKIHCLMIRECRRFDDGLPIFAFRREILQQIHCQQVRHFLFHIVRIFCCLLLFVNFAICLFFFSLCGVILVL